MKNKNLFKTIPIKNKDKNQQIEILVHFSVKMKDPN